MRARLMGRMRPNVTCEVPKYHQACELLSFNGPGSLVINQESRVPSIQGPGQVLVKVETASINPLDLMMTRGYGRQALGSLNSIATFMKGFQHITSVPMCLGRDFSGEVVKLGVGVSHLQVGDKVWGTSFPSSQGTFRQFSVLDGNNVSLKPSNLTHQVAAGIPYAGLTAWSALHLTGGVVKGGKDRRVLVLGAGGAVGGIATQLLTRYLDIEVVGVAGRGAEDLVTGYGAVKVLDYNSDSYQSELSSMSGSIDLVLDCAGLGGRSVDLSPLLRRCGRIVSLTSPLMSNTDKQGLVAGTLASMTHLLKLNCGGFGQFRWAFFQSDRIALDRLTKLCEDGLLSPVPFTVIPLEHISDMFTELELGNIHKKVVVDMW